MSLRSLVILASVAVTVLAQNLQVNTPTSVQACLPVQITWQGGQPPYYLGLIAAGDPSSPMLQDFGSQTGTSYLWRVNEPAGASYTVQIRDNSGQLNYSDKFTIQPSSQTCSTGNSTTSGSPTTGTGKNATGPASSSNTTTATTTTTPSKSNTAGASSSSGSSTPVTASTSSTNTTAGSQARTSDASRLASGAAALGLSLFIALFA